MRFLILSALALAAVPAAALAQTEPSLKGPIHIIGQNEKGASLVAMGTRARDGDRARITRMIVFSQPAMAAGTPVWRIDVTAEFDCKTKMGRPLVLAARDEKGGLISAFDSGEDFGALPPGDPTAPVAMQVACEGTLPANAVAVPDFSSWHTEFRRNGGQ